MDHKTLAQHIWGVAELLRGDFKPSEYGPVILPFTVLRRFECVLEPTRDAVLRQMKVAIERGLDPDRVLPQVSGQPFYNASGCRLAGLGASDTLVELEDYIARFSANVRALFEQFEFAGRLRRLDRSKLLHPVAGYFSAIDLHPGVVSNHAMGLAFEYLVRVFAESARDTGGEFYTPRDLVHLATRLVFGQDRQLLSGAAVIRTVYDPACGTGGFLSEGMALVERWNPAARLVPYGQELNAQTHAIAVADMMIKGENASNIKLGNSLSDDRLGAERFDYCLANPPFGLDWKKVQQAVRAEAARGAGGRFGAGLPRVSDGSLLFLMHLVSKMRSDGPSRIGVLLNGSPLFTGGAGSGESEVRRWVLENDWLEAIVALPTDLFYNTGIATYLWLLSNRKDAERCGKVQLIDAADNKDGGPTLWHPMRKRLGSKRRYLPDSGIDAIAALHAAFGDNARSKVFATTDFGYRRITVQRPLQLRFHPTDPTRLAALTADRRWYSFSGARRGELLAALARCDGDFRDRRDFIDALRPLRLKKLERKLLQKHLGEHDEQAACCRDDNGDPEPNPDLRGHEKVPLGEDVDAYFRREVLPYLPGAWIDRSKTDAKDGAVGIVGYQIPFHRHFYPYRPPRPLQQIDADLDRVGAEVIALLQELLG